MSQSINAKALQFATVAGRAVHAAGEIIKGARAKKAAAETQVPGVVKALKQAGLISEQEEKRAMQQLGDHVGALQVLGNVLQHFQNDATKSASAGISGSSIPSSTPAPANGRTGSAIGDLRKHSAADEAFISRMLPGSRT